MKRMSDKIKESDIQAMILTRLSDNPKVSDIHADYTGLLVR
ncbi:hypothetical protein [Trichococcus shcherbakoviae]|nr:hypothetical protein [Trichococcus shcherbakoviae]